MPYYPRLILYFDGASRRNPNGPAGCGWVLREMDDNGADYDYSIAEGRNYLGYYVSSNQAEYQGLIDGLDFLVENGISCYKLFVRGDSEVVICQMVGDYNVKSPNIKPYFYNANDSLAEVHCDELCFRHIPRDKNWEADELANKAIRKTTSKVNHMY